MHIPSTFLLIRALLIVIVKPYEPITRTKAETFINYLLFNECENFILLVSCSILQVENLANNLKICI